MGENIDMLNFLFVGVLLLAVVTIFSLRTEKKEGLNERPSMDGIVLKKNKDIFFY